MKRKLNDLPKQELDVLEQFKMNGYVKKNEINADKNIIDKLSDEKIIEGTIIDVSIEQDVLDEQDCWVLGDVHQELEDNQYIAELDLVTKGYNYLGEIKVEFDIPPDIAILIGESTDYFAIDVYQNPTMEEEKTELIIDATKDANIIIPLMVITHENEITALVKKEVLDYMDRMASLIKTEDESRI